MCWSGQSPGPMHLGHVTAQKVIDSWASSEQREALAKIMSGQIGGPFAIFTAVTETELDPIFAPFKVTVDGLSSEVSAPGALEMSLTTIKNPVTGVPEELTLLKPTGFTSKEVQPGGVGGLPVHGRYQPRLLGEIRRVLGLRIQLAVNHRSRASVRKSFLSTIMPFS